MSSHERRENASFLDADDVQLTESKTSRNSYASDAAAAPPAVTFSDPHEHRTETANPPGRRNGRGRYRPAQQQMSWLKCGGYFFLAVGALAGTLAVGYHLGRNNIVPTRSKKGSGGGSHGEDHVTPSDGTTLDAAESAGEELTIEMIIQQAEEVTEETPDDFSFPSYIDMSGLSQTHKLLLTTLAKYDFMRDEVVRLVEEDYVDMERSPELDGDSWDFDMLDNALEAMEMYEVDYEPVPVKGHPFMFVGSVGAALNDDSLVKARITHVINWSPSAKCNLYPQFTYMCIEGIRNERQMINQLDKLDSAVDFVYRIYRSGGRIFIHCWYGMNRSVTLVAAYLMKYENMGVADATKLVSKTRSVGEPYMEALSEYDRQYLKRR